MPARAASDTGSRCSNRVVGATRSDQIVGGHDCLWSDSCCDKRRLLKLCATDAEDGEWVDAAFMHALACAVGVTILVFQDGVYPTIIGPHLIDGNDGDCDLVVPVALVNGYHF